MPVLGRLPTFCPVKIPPAELGEVSVTKVLGKFEHHHP